MAGAMAAGSAAQVTIGGGQAHVSMNWVTVRRIMRIAHVVVAAATMAWRGQFFWGPRRADAALASKARLARRSFTGVRADQSKYQPPFYRHVLRALAGGLAASVRLNRAFWHARAWPFALRLARCPTHPLLVGGRSTPWAGCGRDKWLAGPGAGAASARRFPSAPSPSRR